MSSTWSTKELQTTYIILNLNVISHVIVYLIHPAIFYKYRISCIVSTSCRLHIILNLNVYFTWAYLNMQRCYCSGTSLLCFNFLLCTLFTHHWFILYTHASVFEWVCSRGLIGDFILSLSYLFWSVYESHENRSKPKKYLP